MALLRLQVFVRLTFGDLGELRMNRLSALFGCDAACRDSLLSCRHNIFTDITWSWTLLCSSLLNNSKMTLQFWFKMHQVCSVWITPLEPDQMIGAPMLALKESKQYHYQLWPVQEWTCRSMFYWADTEQRQHAVNELVVSTCLHPKFPCFCELSCFNIFHVLDDTVQCFQGCEDGKNDVAVVAEVLVPFEGSH